jgi:hypothetical protein
MLKSLLPKEHLSHFMVSLIPLLAIQILLRVPTLLMMVQLSASQSRRVMHSIVCFHVSACRTLHLSFCFKGTEDVSGINELIFTSPDLQPGRHTIKITYNGNDTSVPLVVDYFDVVTNPSSSSDLSIPSSISVSSSPEPTASTNSATTVKPTHKVLDHNVVIGAVLGVIFILTAVVSGLIWWLRYQRRQRSRVYDASLDREYAIDPFRVPNDSTNVNPPTMKEASSSQHSALGLVLGPLSPPLGLPIGAAPPKIVLHEDSGIRMIPGDRVEARIVNIPPGYSPS